MLISLDNLEKRYKARRGGVDVMALRGVSLSINEGEMVAIKGSSGAGKTTLLHILGCLDKPSSGSYLLGGTNVSQFSLSKLAKLRNKKFGFVMQHFALIDEDNALQNVGIPLLLGKTSLFQIDNKAKKQLDALGIGNLANQKTAKLSGGEKQRVAIARALVNDPDIILADEPTGALDSKNAHMIMDILRQLNENGKTIIIVTHEDFVAQACHRTITISDGKIL